MATTTTTANPSSGNQEDIRAGGPEPPGRQGAETPTDDAVVETVWSDLPKTHMEAVRVTGRLKKKGLLKAGSKGHCIATEAGTSLIKAANKGNFWQQAPLPATTNPKWRA
jgi:hypothetical protein